MCDKLGKHRKEFSVVMTVPKVFCSLKPPTAKVTSILPPRIIMVHHTSGLGSAFAGNSRAAPPEDALPSPGCGPTHRPAASLTGERASGWQEP